VEVVETTTSKGAIRMKITTIGLDLAQSIFQVHAVDGDGNVVVRKALRRAQVLTFFKQTPPCDERCALVLAETPGSADKLCPWS
jgi:transposase